MRPFRAHSPRKRCIDSPELTGIIGVQVESSSQQTKGSFRCLGYSLFHGYSSSTNEWETVAAQCGHPVNTLQELAPPQLQESKMGHATLLLRTSRRCRLRDRRWARDREHRSSSLRSISTRGCRWAEVLRWNSPPIGRNTCAAGSVFFRLGSQ